MELLKEIPMQFLEILKEIFKSFWEVLPKALEFMLWFICAFVVLPAVFIANVWYPKWQEWGEDF
jgi:hypothetical protein